MSGPTPARRRVGVASGRSSVQEGLSVTFDPEHLTAITVCDGLIGRVSFLKVFFSTQLVAVRMHLQINTEPENQGTLPVF